MILECVQCGYCCRVRPCAFGTWDSEKKQQCTFLTEEDFCSKYEEIKKLPGAEYNPAFGTGCSSALFNSFREKKIKERFKAENKIVW